MAAILVGRFQPVHLGHIHTIRQILSREDELIVAIGSAQYSHTPDNPFSGGERLMLLKRAILDEKMPLERLSLVPVPDIHIHPLWVSHISSLTPYFDRVYSHNPIVRQLFRDAGIEVGETDLLERGTYSAHRIRKLIREGEKWEHLVPPGVAEMIKKYNLDERIRAIGDTRLKK